MNQREGHALSEIQELQARQAVERAEMKRLQWEQVPVGYETTWEETVSQDAVFAHADAVEDYNPWYGERRTPFGFPIAPPMLVPLWGSRTTTALGLRTGWIQTDHETELLAPVRVGSRVRYHGQIVDKFEKNGRHWVVEQVEAVDAETGEILTRETKRFIIRYTRGRDNQESSRL